MSFYVGVTAVLSKRGMTQRITTNVPRIRSPKMTAVHALPAVLAVPTAVLAIPFNICSCRFAAVP